jgi:hypothetical protein
METIEEMCQRLEALHQKHQAAPFPRHLLEPDREGDLYIINSIISSCVSTFLKDDRMLDLHRTAQLGICYHATAKRLPDLPEEAILYYSRLEMMANIVLYVVGSKSGEE